MENIIKYKNFDGTVIWDSKEQKYTGYILDIPDKITYSEKTKEDLYQEFQFAVDAWIDFCAIKEQDEENVRNTIEND